MFSLQAFCQQEGDGTTYYDAAKTKMKEQYTLREKTTIVQTPDGTKPVKTFTKTGPYFYYYENGKVKITGNYKDNMKSGEWKYYDEKGKLLKTEKYDKDKLLG